MCLAAKGSKPTNDIHCGAGSRGAVECVGEVERSGVLAGKRCVGGDSIQAPWSVDPDRVSWASAYVRGRIASSGRTG